MPVLKRLKRKIQQHLLPAIPHTVWTNPLHYIACGFGVGCSPIMPGTLGTLLGVGLYLILAKLSVSAFVIILVLLNLLGCWLCGLTNKDFGYQDHSAVCYDELVTFPLCLIALPNHWLLIVCAFIVFRILDIAKPGPIGYIDRHIHGGIGVMLDDILAALATWGILQLGYFVFTAFFSH